MPSLLPREGLTLEALFSPVYHTVLNPLLTGTVLYGLVKHPSLTDNWLSLSRLGNQSSQVKVISILFSLSLLGRLNKWFSNIALNNFITDAMWDLKKEVIVVTGGSSGIGAVITSKLSERGSTVIILDLNPPAKSLPRNTHFYPIDITSTTQLQNVADKIRATHGNPTVLINNAGIGTPRLILDEDPSAVQKVFDVNVIAHFALVKQFLPAMVKANHGHIVTVASMASFMTQAQNVAYACTKAAALSFHEGLAMEIRYRYDAPRVRTSIVHPTWIRTPLIDQLTKTPTFNEFVLEPETVADAVVDQLSSGYGAQIILPARLSLFSGARGFPSWLQQFLRGGMARTIPGVASGAAVR